MTKELNLNERIFVAGGGGMAGSAICRALYKNNYGKTNKGKILSPTREELDLFDLNAIKAWFKLHKPTVLIIAAAKVGGIIANSNFPATFLLENLKIQLNLFEACREFKIKKVLFLGSSCIYPKFAQQPIKEEYLLSGFLEPSNQWYALAKIAGIKSCEALRLEHNIDAISLMPTNLYGPGDNYHNSNSHVLAAFIRRFYEARINKKKEVICWGTGSPLREFLHVDDLGEAVVFALNNWDPDSINSPRDKNGEKLFFLNIGTGKEISIKDLAYLIKNELNYTGRIIWDHSKPDGTPRKLLNIDRIKSLGWYPKIKLDEGIRQTIKDFIDKYDSNKLRLN